MAYYHEFIYEVWFKDDATSKAYCEDYFYNEDDAERTIQKYKDDINAHPEWGYGDEWEVYMVVIDNPEYDFDRVLRDDAEDHYSHRF